MADGDKGTDGTDDRMSPSGDSSEAGSVGRGRAAGGVDRLVRFQVEAYKARIEDLKRSLARERAEKQALTRQLTALNQRHRTLKELLGWIDRQLDSRIQEIPKGEEK
jgi:predicted RNase H-like nuclease (RuvC/YqgF family)